jgi:hypothetical protein
MHGLDLSEADTARALAAALNRALALGQPEHAERIARTAWRLALRHPKLVETLARWRATRGEFDAALALIESYPGQSASLRLLRIVCLLRLGRRLEAQVDLREWARRASAPLQARLLLGLLEWRGQDAVAATSALLENLRQLDDPQSIAALMLIAVAQDRRELAQHWAGRLNQSQATDLGIDQDVLVESLGLRRAVPGQDAIAQTRIATLATELLASEEVVPALVESQRLAMDHQYATLLARAIERAMPEFEDRGAAQEAARRLAEVLQAAETPAVVHAADALQRDVLGTIRREPGVAGELGILERAA